VFLVRGVVKTVFGGILFCSRTTISKARLCDNIHISSFHCGNRENMFSWFPLKVVRKKDYIFFYGNQENICYKLWKPREFTLIIGDFFYRGGKFYVCSFKFGGENSMRDLAGKDSMRDLAEVL